MSKAVTLAEVAELVHKFAASEQFFVSPQQKYREAEARSEFIDPLLEALGWDTANKTAVYPAMREVIREESQEREDSAAKKPDYTLCVNRAQKLYVEAKKPSVNVMINMDSIRQTRAYGYTKSHPIAVLTNFKDICVYDTTIAVSENDTPDTCRIYHWNYSEFVAKWGLISRVFGRDSVGSENWEEQFGSTGPLQPVPADKAFVAQLNQWRIEIATDIVERRPAISEPLLNDVVQRLLNRLVFIRMCEDRGIEGMGVLRKAFASDTASVTELFKGLNDRYNTGLFNGDADSDDPSVLVDSRLMANIVESLYSPRSTLSFAVLDADFLGLVYEATLTEHLTIVRTNHEVTVSLNSKPEYAKRDVVTTPQRLVDSTVEAAITHIGADIAAPKVLDFATGSGRFLISAFDRLLDRYTRSLIGTGSRELIKVGANEWRLGFEAKRNLLTENFFGIDVDFNAVEVARFSLFVRLLEEESIDTLPLGRKILPDLEKNIVHGNTLVRALPGADDDQLAKTMPLNLSSTQFPTKFDLIIGNPPYMKTEEMKSYDRVEYDYLKANYELLHQQFDKYIAFVEFAMNHLADKGCVGVVIPNKWMTLVAGEKLRERLRSDVRVVHLSNFRHVQVFAAKTIYVCVLVVQRSEDVDFGYSEPDSIEQYASGRAAVYSIRKKHLPIGHAGPWVLPANKLEDKVLRAIRATAVPLESLVSPRNGIQTSKNAIYVITNPIVNGNKVKFTKGGKEWTIELGLTRPYLDDSTLVSSYRTVQADARVIFPYQRTNNATNTSGYELIPITRMKQLYPLGYAYLLASRGAISSRDMGERAVAFYAYGRTQAIGYCAQAHKIIYSVNQTGNKYGFDESGVVYASGGTAGEVALYPKAPDVSLDFILALLDQKPIEFFLRKRGSPFRGGYYARGTDVIGDVPVPSLNFANEGDVAFHDTAAQQMKTLRDLHSRTDSIAARHRTQHQAKIDRAKEQMDTIFMARWGLSQHDYDRLKL